MVGLALSPVPSNWLLLMVLLCSGGETVHPTPKEDLFMDSPGRSCSQVWQNPRFVARKRGYLVEIKCHTDGSGNVTWFRQRSTDRKLQELFEDQSHIFYSKNNTVHTLTIKDIQFEDNGIYFCRRECTSNEPPEEGCGTELRVMGFSSLAQLKRRNTLKDGIIMIQTLLIILFIVVPIFLLLDKQDDGKAGMEEDHTYEGLNIDQTATYEDIVTLRTGEVKWSVGEHPGQE